jgi:flagellar assembly protein FliH
MTMASAMKFLFDNSFDVAESPALSPAAPPRQFSEEDILAARDEGFAQGEAAGRAAALTSIEQASAKTLTVIGARLNDAGQEIERIRAATMSDALKVLGAAIRKVIPELARRNALNEIEQLVRECLQAIYDEPRVVVRGHDRVIAALQPRIDAMAASCGFHGKIVLFADDQLNETDCRVEWADGGAERNLDDMWRQIDAALERIADDGAAAPAGSETSKP